MAPAGVGSVTQHARPPSLVLVILPLLGVLGCGEPTSDTVGRDNGTDAADADTEPEGTDTEDTDTDTTRERVGHAITHTNGVEDEVDVRPLDAWRACTPDADCSYAMARCDECCAYAAVARAHFAEWHAAYRQECADYDEGFCDCEPHRVYSWCQGDLCVVDMDVGTDF